MAHPKLLQAVEEFNQRKFWTCHETLEDLWRAEEGPLKQFYQGIIHVAAGFVHVQRRNFEGATQRLRSGIEKLASFEPETEGLEVAGLNRDTHRALEAVLQLGRLHLDRFDEKLYPRITFFHHG